MKKLIVLVMTCFFMMVSLTGVSAAKLDSAGSEVLEVDAV